MTLNKFLWLRVHDALDIFHGRNLPADGRRRLAAKWNTPVILEAVSIGHHVPGGINDELTRTVGIVVRDHRDLLWQARYEIGPFDEHFPEEVRGFVKFTRVVESPPVRAFMEVP